MMVNRATEVHLYSVRHVALSLQLIITQIRKKKTESKPHTVAMLTWSRHFPLFFNLQPSVTSLFAIFNPNPFLYLLIHVVASIETASWSIRACLTPEVLVLEAWVWRLTLKKNPEQGVQSSRKSANMLSSRSFGLNLPKGNWATHSGRRWNQVLQQQTCSYRVSLRLVVLLPEL